MILSGLPQNEKEMICVLCRSHLFLTNISNYCKIKLNTEVVKGPFNKLFC